MIRTIALILSLLAAPLAAEPHRVLSYNIRFGSAGDGPDRWELRRGKVAQTIRDLDADVVGLQEVEAFQVRELLEALPSYAAVGVHRDDGKLAGEAAPLLYDRTRYTLDRTGTFWLSDTPDIVASNTWGAACNRTCTWARLVDLKTGEAFSVYNTHWDHVSQPAREGSARLIVQRIDNRPDDGPFIVMGDMNADEDNPAFRILLEGAGGSNDGSMGSSNSGWRMTDTYREHHPAANAGTFTGFRLDSDGGDRKIDHVLRGPGLRVLDAGIDRRKIDGRYPSDHFPVWADVVIED